MSIGAGYGPQLLALGQQLGFGGPGPAVVPVAGMGAATTLAQPTAANQPAAPTTSRPIDPQTGLPVGVASTNGTGQAGSSATETPQIDPARMAQQIMAMMDQQRAENERALNAK